MGDGSRIETCILGAGMTGLSVAYFMKRPYRLFEQSDQVGGLCNSKYTRGFTFDTAEHFLRVPDEMVMNVLRTTMKENLFSQNLKASIFLYNRHILYPFQKHLYGLPDDILDECLTGFIDAQERLDLNTPFSDYKDWIMRIFGQGIAKHFMIPYNTKIWTVPPERMEANWTFDKNVVPTFDVETVKHGAITPPQENDTNQVRWYAARGGAKSIADSFMPHVSNIEFKKKAMKINAKQKIIVFEDGTSKQYGNLISTIPLNELVNIVDNAPENILHSARKLRYNSAACIYVALKTAVDNLNHWIYFPEPKYSFCRAFFPGNFSENNVPRGKGAIGCLITHPMNEEIDVEAIKSDIVEELVDAGLISSNRMDCIEFIDVIKIKHAFVIPERGYRDLVKEIIEYLKSQNIFSVGRYGEWKYSGVEHAIHDGYDITNRVLDLGPLDS